ncbi:MAG TPA: uroporphyrinogen decarboxylase family protein [Ruminiclostridium sp.]
MKPYDRVYNRLQGKPVDRAPNLNILMAFAAKFIDIPLDKFCTDYKYLTRANIKCNEAFGIDMLNTMSDPFREAADFGAEVIFPYDNLPLCKKRFLEDYSDIKKLKIFKPIDSKRMLDRIHAIEYYKQETGNNYSILGWVEGSLAEAADLRGVSNFMEDFYDEPEFAKELMTICLEEGVICAKEQIKAGADFIGIGDAVASLLSPAMYLEFVLPFEQKLIKEIHDNGAKVKLHICGNISHLLDHIRLSGADIIDIDHMVDYKTSVSKLKGFASVNGNMDPVSIVNQGTPETVKKAVYECLLSGDEYSFISSGCEIPKSTPNENLKAVDLALNEYADITKGVTGVN